LSYAEKDFFTKYPNAADDLKKNWGEIVTAEKKKAEERRIAEEKQKAETELVKDAESLADLPDETFDLEGLIVTAKHLFFYAAQYRDKFDEVDLTQLLRHVNHTDFLGAIRRIGEPANKDLFPEILFKCAIDIPNKINIQRIIISALVQLFGVDQSIEEKLHRFTDRFLQFWNDLVTHWSTYFLLNHPVILYARV
jgi:hypothetical protein